MTNPLLAEWAGPYGGVPRLADVKVTDFEPALAAAMSAQHAAVEEIANNPAPPTFENTLAAMERSGRQLDRVLAVYNIWSQSMTSPEFQAVERTVAPKLAAFQDGIVQNRSLWKRIAAVYQARQSGCESEEQRRLAWLYHTNFVRAGAALDDLAKERVAAINQRLALLFTSFQHNVLADEGTALWLEDEHDLAGLPPSVRASTAVAAAAHGRAGRWAVLNTSSSVEPFLRHSQRRDLREKVWHMFVERGDHGNATDNKQIISEILQLRAERARLLGYPTHAHWRLDDCMAKTPDRAMRLMEGVWLAAVERVREEVADMQAIADRDGVAAIQPWDYRYYAEQVRKAKYALDENQVKPYLQLEKLREAMFYVAAKLFDLHFEAAAGVPVHHPDVRVWKVTDGDGKHVGLWYFDPWARPGKRSGAWMDVYRKQELFDGEITTIVSNDANFVKGKPGEPALVSWTDAETLFHEFGHALHGLCSHVTYPSLSGTAVPSDYVEFPSQLFERWLNTPEVLGKYALHVETGAPLPNELVDKLERASKFNQGFITAEQVAAALVDMKAHLAGDRPIEPAAFERETLKAIGMPREIVLRHRMPHFNHVFASDSYAAGYYSYLWADTLSADAFEAFLEAKGPYDEEVASRLRRHVFGAGNTVDPAEAYRAFRGRDAAVDALMRRRGFPTRRD